MINKKLLQVNLILMQKILIKKIACLHYVAYLFSLKKNYNSCALDCIFIFPRLLFLFSFFVLSGSPFPYLI